MRQLNNVLSKQWKEIHFCCAGRSWQVALSELVENGGADVDTSASLRFESSVAATNKWNKSHNCKTRLLEAFILICTRTSYSKQSRPLLRETHASGHPPACPRRTDVRSLHDISPTDGAGKGMRPKGGGAASHFDS